MFQAAISEFPFVESLPKREKSRLRTMWDHVNALIEASEKDGFPIQQAYAARLLGFSRQRMCALVDQGRFRTVEVNGERFVTMNSVMEFAETERKNGRPVDLSLRRQHNISKELFEEQKKRK